VIKTLSGCGPAAGEAIDCIGLPHVVGSIAGDNTLLLIIDHEDNVEEILSIFNDMLIMRSKGL
jgi:transcriptional regulator of arginine metabolism